VANSHAEHLAPAVSVDADGDDHRDRDDLMIPATFHLERFPFKVVHIRLRRSSLSIPLG